MPTYESIGDHTEALRVYYDPAVVSYDELLKKFWAEHGGKLYSVTGPSEARGVWIVQSWSKLKALFPRVEGEQQYSILEAYRALTDIYGRNGPKIRTA